MDYKHCTCLFDFFFFFFSFNYSVLKDLFSKSDVSFCFKSMLRFSTMLFIWHTDLFGSSSIPMALLNFPFTLCADFLVKLFSSSYSSLSNFAIILLNSFLNISSIFLSSWSEINVYGIILKAWYYLFTNVSGAPTLIFAHLADHYISIFVYQ